MRGRFGMILLIIVIVLLGGLFWYFRSSPYLSFLRGGTSGQLVAKVTYACDMGKTIAASYYQGDKGSVKLLLSDGRSITLPQTISASGIAAAPDGARVCDAA